MLILTGIHEQNGNLAKDLAGYVELQQAAKLITNKQFGAMIHRVRQRQAVARTLGQDAQADKEFRQILQAAEKALGKQHYLYTLFDLEHAYFLMTTNNV